MIRNASMQEHTLHVQQRLKQGQLMLLLKPMMMLVHIPAHRLCPSRSKLGFPSFSNGQRKREVIK
jgi:hypothetical protein